MISIVDIITGNANITRVYGLYSQLEEMLNFGLRLIKVRCNYFPIRFHQP